MTQPPDHSRWDTAERERLRDLYTGRNAPLMPAIVATLNSEFGHIRPPRSLKSVKSKACDMGLKRHPKRRIDILGLNRAAVPDTSPLADSEAMLRAPYWSLPPDAFRDMPDSVLRREAVDVRRVSRPLAYSPAGCALASVSGL